MLTLHEGTPDGNVNSARHDDGGIRGRVAIFIMDITRDGAKGALDGWLGAQAADVVCAQGSRYVVVLTINTGGDPRYVHNIECVPDMPTVIDALTDAQLFVQRTGYELGLSSPGTPNACMTDVRLRLDDSDMATVDAWLDRISREFLARSDVTAGCA